MIRNNCFVHETAIIDENVTVGDNTKIWHFSHIQSGAIIGSNCSLGQNVNVSNNVTLGDGIKVQNNVSIYEGVTIEDYVFCGPSCVFTNDLTPRARYPKNHKYLPTVIRHDATLGANCTIVCGHEVGHHATIAAGAVVVSNVPPHALFAGVPAKQIGWVCECGQVLKESKFNDEIFLCPDCRRRYIKRQNDQSIQEKGVQLRIYLDQHVYIKTLDNEIDRNMLIQYRQFNDCEFVYGLAHMEEVYRVASDDVSHHKGKVQELLKVIKEVSDSREILSSSEGLFVKSESPESCYRRVKGFETIQRVEDGSILRFSIDMANYKKILAEDKHNQSISTLSAKEIWKNKMVEALIDNLNKDSSNIVSKYNNSTETIGMLLLGLNRHLPDDFKVETGNYKDRLKGTFDELEYTIEILMSVLNFCGYNAEKSEQTAISLTHDVTHCIYGTECDYLITMDKPFARKCEAVYEFIGANTKVLYCTDPSALMEALNDIAFKNDNHNAQNTM